MLVSVAQEGDRQLLLSLKVSLDEKLIKQKIRPIMSYLPVTRPLGQVTAVNGTLKNKLLIVENFLLVFAFIQTLSISFIDGVLLDHGFETGQVGVVLLHVGSQNHPNNPLSKNLKLILCKFIRKIIFP